MRADSKWIVVVPPNSSKCLKRVVHMKCWMTHMGKLLERAVIEGRAGNLLEDGTLESKPYDDLETRRASTVWVVCLTKELVHDCLADDYWFWRKHTWLSCRAAFISFC